jgi:hypothetical protein
LENFGGTQGLFFSASSPSTIETNLSIHPSIPSHPIHPISFPFHPGKKRAGHEQMKPERTQELKPKQQRKRVLGGTGYIRTLERQETPPFLSKPKINLQAQEWPAMTRETPETKHKKRSRPQRKRQYPDSVGVENAR